MLEKRKKYDPRAAIKNSKKVNPSEPTSTIEHDTSAVAMISDKPLPGETIDPEDDEAPKDRDPNLPARPFLKRKTKAVLVDKSQGKYKP